MLIKEYLNKMACHKNIIKMRYSLVSADRGFRYVNLWNFMVQTSFVHTAVILNR